jgi:hypothetical protein
MRQLTYFHSSPITPGEEALLRAMHAERDWQTLAFTEGTPISDVSVNVTPGSGITTALISGSMQRPAQLGRALRRHCPSCLILFFADEKELPAVRRQLGVAPILGPNWKLIRADIAEIQHCLSAAQAAAGRQQRVRTTLQRVGERLASPPVRPETRFRRQALSERYLAGVLSHGFDAVVCFNDRQEVIAWNAAAKSSSSCRIRKRLGAIYRNSARARYGRRFSQQCAGLSTASRSSASSVKSAMAMALRVSSK